MGAWRTVLDNCMLSEDYQLLDSDAPRWLKIPNRDDQPKLPFYGTGSRTLVMAVTALPKLFGYRCQAPQGQKVDH